MAIPLPPPAHLQCSLNSQLKHALFHTQSSVFYSNTMNKRFCSHFQSLCWGGGGAWEPIALIWIIYFQISLLNFLFISPQIKNIRIILRASGEAAKLSCLFCLIFFGIYRARTTEDTLWILVSYNWINSHPVVIRNEMGRWKADRWWSNTKS